MASNIMSIPAGTARENSLSSHRRHVTALVLLLGSLIAYLAIHGWPYYRLALDERPLSPLHSQLRSSGSLGVKLGVLGVCMFGILFLYPLRKRWPWLASIGSTRRWLDFHVVMGITAPIVISFHAGFKFHGLAGLAYWIMLAVALSGFIGRYVYAQIPRSLNAIKLTVDELAAQSAALSAGLAEQHTIDPTELADFLAVPSPAEVRKMSLLSALWTMLVNDVARPLRIARLRRRFLTGFELLTSLGGLASSRHPELEDVIRAVRRQARLTTKIAFLDKTERLFYLWHVVHRPFSMSFVALVVIHIGVILMLGYY